MNSHLLIKTAIYLLLSVLILSIVVFLASPLPESLSSHKYSTILNDNKGVLLGASIAEDEQWRFPLESSLPKKYITALIHFEDKRFYYHPGIDPLAIVRAIKINNEQGRVVSGGSTITMQLARLISGNRTRSYWQKTKEMILAFKLELRLSKDEILYHYAGLAPFGGNTVGISAANWRYFNTHLEDVTWSQAALLAVLPNNPSSLHPGKNREALLAKRNKLLRKLNSLGYLTNIDLKLSLLEELPKRPLPMPITARHVLDTLKKKYPDQDVFNTFLDTELQKYLIILLDSYNKAYEKHNIFNLSVVVIENNTQHVIAYVGNSTRSKSVTYAPAMDIAQRPRSSGSLFKPFLFAEMVEQGYLLPDSLIEDIPSYYDGYNPKNYDRDYRGLVPAKQALTQSLNVPAVRMLKEYGVSQFKEDLKGIGLTTLWRPAEDYGLSLILGGAETTLWEITNTFSRMMLSAQGEGSSLREALIFDGQVIEGQHYPIGQGASWLTLNALLEVNRPGIAANWKDFNSSQKIAWKTGTSYGWHDAWAIGTNGKYTVGVWAGNANGEEARQLTGAKTSAPIMLDTFSYLGGGEFPDIPYYALKEYDVCEVDSYLPSEGCKTKAAFAPKEANFSISSIYHQLIHVDQASGLRVHGLCESIDNMKPETYFIIPPVHASFFSTMNADIAPIPEWRPDCVANLPSVTNEKPFDLEYPTEGARVKIPVELDGKLGRVIVKAHHKAQKATLFWHVDNKALGKTTHIHEQQIVVNPGWHQLILVDDNGFKLVRWFKAI